MTQQKTLGKSEAASLAADFSEELLRNVVPFWEQYSPDWESGGYFNCLDRDGTIFDTDKFMWMQGRELWCFSHLYKNVEADPKWMKLARSGAEFIETYGRADNGDFYFAVDRNGNPLVQPYNIFSDCFCAAGLAEYSRISGNDKMARDSITIWRRIQERKVDPKGIWTKQIAKSRPTRTMAMSMMQIWMAKVFSGLIPRAELDSIIEESVRNVLLIHLDRKKKALFERVFADGSRPQGMDGRLLSPGHALETLWFILDAVSSRPDGLRFLPEGFAIEDVTEPMLWTISRGWDDENGGIYYYRDYDNLPLDKLESDMKLWWVHAEALCAFLLAYKLTGGSEYLSWFETIKDWTWTHFRDPDFGEWFGYLDRKGVPSSSLKGGKWKGMFHIPRALLFCRGILQEFA
jgi:N-acylglucosamine 2-epimerase